MVVAKLTDVKSNGHTFQDGKMMAESELIVHALPMVELNGATNIPTVVTYSKSRTIIGQEAQALSREDNSILNEDFKIDLGNYEPTAVKRKRFATSLSVEKSAAEITADFLGTC
ncbi:MAG: hypothetical protein WA354_03265 [Terracidiphilus sp.]